MNLSIEKTENDEDDETRAGPVAAWLVSPVLDFGYSNEPSTGFRDSIESLAVFPALKFDYRDDLKLKLQKLRDTWSVTPIDDFSHEIGASDRIHEALESMSVDPISASNYVVNVSDLGSGDRVESLSVGIPFEYNYERMSELKSREWEKSLIVSPTLDFCRQITVGSQGQDLPELWSVDSTMTFMHEYKQPENAEMERIATLGNSQMNQKREEALLGSSAMEMSPKNNAKNSDHEEEQETLSNAHESDELLEAKKRISAVPFENEDFRQIAFTEVGRGQAPFLDEEQIEGSNRPDKFNFFKKSKPVETPRASARVDMAYEKGDFLNQDFDELWGKTQKIYFKDSAEIEPQTKSTQIFQKMIEKMNKNGISNETKWLEKKNNVHLKKKESVGLLKRVLKTILRKKDLKLISNYSKDFLKAKIDKLTKHKILVENYEESMSYNMFIDAED